MRILWIIFTSEKLVAHTKPLGTRKVCLSHAGGLRCHNLSVTLHSRKRGLSSKRFKGVYVWNALKPVWTCSKPVSNSFKLFQCHEGTQIAWTVRILEGPIQFTVTSLQQIVWYRIRARRYNPFLSCIVIHKTHYEKSDWSRAFNQFTIACELEIINAISAVDIAFIMSSSTSAWLPSPLECSPQKQNGWMSSFSYCLKNV